MYLFDPIKIRDYIHMCGGFAFYDGLVHPPTKEIMLDNIQQFMSQPISLRSYKKEQLIELHEALCQEGILIEKQWYSEITSTYGDLIERSKVLWDECMLRDLGIVVELQKLTHPSIVKKYGTQTYQTKIKFENQSAPLASIAACGITQIIPGYRGPNSDFTVYLANHSPQWYAGRAYAFELRLHFTNELRVHADLEHNSNPHVERQQSDALRKHIGNIQLQIQSVQQKINDYERLERWIIETRGKIKQQLLAEFGDRCRAWLANDTWEQDRWDIT